MNVDYQQNVLSQLHAYELGELDEDQVVELFQHLIDTALVWDLQGSYGRTAISLINQGLITAPRVTKDECLNATA